jgi:hypothetical protein
MSYLSYIYLNFIAFISVFSLIFLIYVFRKKVKQFKKEKLELEEWLLDLIEVLKQKDGIEYPSIVIKKLETEIENIKCNNENQDDLRIRKSHALLTGIELIEKNLEFIKSLNL